MTPKDKPTSPARWSMRVRMVLTFAGLAVIPFLVSMLALFHIARNDVSTMAGSGLANQAAFLSEEIEAQIDGGAVWLRSLASMPEMRDHLLDNAPYPEQAIAEARLLRPDVTKVQISTATPPHGGLHVQLQPSGALIYRVAIPGKTGSDAGTLTATVEPLQVQRFIQRFRKGEHGVAVLYSDEGVIQSSRTGVEPPTVSPEQAQQPWFRFDVGEASDFASIARVGEEGRHEGSWQLAVVSPASEVLSNFYFAASQVGFMVLILATMVLALAWRMADLFLRPIMEIRHGAEIISRINLNHRLKVETGDELEKLANEFNHMAEALQNAYGELEGRVSEMTRDLQEERNRLATVLRMMVEGLVVTNEAGEVILMNPRARAALATGPSSGIGSPLTRLLPPARLDYHLRRLRAAWEQKQEAVEHVLFPMESGKLLRGVITTVPTPSGARAGFLLVFRDVSLEAVQEDQAEAIVHRLPERIKSPLSSIRSMSEILNRRHDLPEAKREAFLTALAQESVKCIEALGEVEQVATRLHSSRWPEQPADPRELVEEALSIQQGIFSNLVIGDETIPPVVVEPYSWIAALAAVLEWVAGKSCGWKPLEAVLEAEEEMVVLTIRLPGDVTVDASEFVDLQVCAPGESPVALGEAVRRNRGEIWTRRTDEGFEVRLGMTRASASPETEAVARILDDQPEFYDFDLFLPRPGPEAKAQLESELAELDFVVFDSETTGLSPSRGDRMVSLSGVRVRRGRVLKADTFHTLIHPGMTIPEASIAFHGITDEMVADAPSLAEIYPQFVEYVGKSTLVAHNAAFDKKFLDIAAADSRLPTMENPVLDTLFLSYGVHRDLEGHNIEAISKRLGVEVQGRHTSLGDAMTTAEIFIHLLPLLASRGVTTLAQAKSFCDKMLLLRWQNSRF